MDVVAKIEDVVLQIEAKTGGSPYEGTLQQRMDDVLGLLGNPVIVVRLPHIRLP